MVAVKQDGNTLQYVKEQTLAICLVAIQQNANVIMFISPELKDSISKINLVKKEK